MGNNRRLLKLKKQKLEELNKYTYEVLSKTDWVIVKIKEMEILRTINMVGEKAIDYMKRINGEVPFVNVPQIIASYGHILSERLKIRIWHDEMEKKIMEATTVKELEKIKIGDKQ